MPFLILISPVLQTHIYLHINTQRHMQTYTNPKLALWSVFHSNLFFHSIQSYFSTQLAFYQVRVLNMRQASTKFSFFLGPTPEQHHPCFHSQRFLKHLCLHVLFQLKKFEDVDSTGSFTLLHLLLFIFCPVFLGILFASTGIKPEP